jgi:transcriptional regulator with XRE-family HTH domain
MGTHETWETTISTIEDVARLAGVSRGSVSNVLTGKVRMRDATRERVLEAARTLASGHYPSIALPSGA